MDWADDEVGRIISEASGKAIWMEGIAASLRTAEKRGRVAGLREARILAVTHSQYPVETDFDRGYEKARRDAGGKIKSAADKLEAETPSDSPA